MQKKSLKRIVVKIGTRVLTNKENRIDKDIISSLVNQVSELRQEGHEIILVSSGAIGAGLGLLNLTKKNKSLSELQAIASVGQNHLMDIYNEFFSKSGYVAGQILLTQEDFNDRRRFLNIRYTLNTLLQYKAVPIINENDSVCTDEIKTGDNDRLSSLVADLANADMLVILTDVEGLYDAEGNHVDEVESITAIVRGWCKGKGCEESTGGMITKLEAMKNVTNSGITGYIAKGRRENVIVDIVQGKKVGTKFMAQKKALAARKRWIAFSKKPKGSVIVDEGAERAIVMGNKSLLPGGIINVTGKFSDGDVVEIKTSAKKVIAKGLTNYTSEEVLKIMGKKTDQIEALLGHKDYDEVVHRDNLVVVGE